MGVSDYGTNGAGESLDPFTQAAKIDADFGRSYLDEEYDHEATEQPCHICAARALGRNGPSQSKAD